MKIWGITDTGLVRQENQDSFLTASTERYDILVVCDGMGGTNGGKIASTIASACFMQELTESAMDSAKSMEVAECMQRAITRSNDAIRERAQEDETVSHMGTTLVGAVCTEKVAVVCNIGDSRAYYLTVDGITQITRDHSVVENMVERGEITQNEARHHPSRNIITRALGPDPEVEADYFTVEWKSGDYLMLCSDGLVNTVTDQEMLFEVIHAPHEEECLQRLLEIAKHNGAPDNVTAVLIKNEGGEMA